MNKKAKISSVGTKPCKDNAPTELKTNMLGYFFYKDIVPTELYKK
ncbi:MAG: hypothetical protein ACRCZI_10715 [Cetobacterium sp.]